jgi:hypothetical protein
MTDHSEETMVLRVVVRRMLAADNLANLPLHFDAAVLDRYRGAGGYSMIRTNTVGRIKREGAWAIDVGIAPGEDMVHVFAGDLRSLPAEEREHWASFAVAPPSSKMFLQMRLQPSACHDDGEPRPWQ